MQAYLSYLSHILQAGTRSPDRTGTGTISVFGRHLSFDLQQGFPLVTTKRVWMRGIVAELLWFLDGGTNIRPLVEQGVSIWTDWPLRHYREATGEAIAQDDFEQRICNDADFAAEWGDLGPVYGKQWRDFDGVDQLARLVERLRSNPHSRRHVVSAWHPAQVEAMALPPCHYAFQCHVEPVSQGRDRLSLMWQQRSVDSFLGLPFNIASYALLTHLLAAQTGYTPGTLHFSGGNCHIYQNHMEQVRTQLERTPYALPTLTVDAAPSLFDYTPEHIHLHDYDHHPALPAPIAV